MNRIGDALDDNVLIGPLHSKASLDKFKQTIDIIKKEGGNIELGGKVCTKIYIFLFLEKDFLC